jgi:DNA polymerase III delta prime subunit
MNGMISHHAVLFSSESPLSSVLDTYSEVPVIDQYRLAQFGIDDVRTLIAHAHRRPDGITERRTIIVATEFVTEEAQQALLKIIEEPPLSTAFVFVIPEGYTFLPTLESRFERGGSLEGERAYTEFDSFRNASYSERMAQIELALKQKDQLWQRSIKKGLIAYLRLESTKLPKEVLVELEYITRLLLTRGASNKFLFEHLTLVLPA